MSNAQQDSQQDPHEGSTASADFQAAVERLERAVHQLVNAKKDEFSGRATAFIDDTTRRLQREFGAGGEQGGRYRRRHHGSQERRPYGRRSRLDRDPGRAKIAGVCAAIADHYSMEPWVVRCIAVTGLLFLPSIVFPAYWIAYFVMKKSPPGGARERGRATPQQDHSSPAPELGPRLSPRHSLGNVQDTLAQAELKLRRMESHITSGQFDLQRELHKIGG